MTLMRSWREYPLRPYFEHAKTLVDTRKHRSSMTAADKRHKIGVNTTDFNLEQMYHKSVGLRYQV